MEPTLLNIDVIYERVIAAGEMDMFTAPVLVEKVLELAGPDRCPLDLDLSQVTFIDSKGLHALIQLRALVPMLRVVACSSQVARVLEITGLTATILEAA